MAGLRTAGGRHSWRGRVAAPAIALAAAATLAPALLVGLPARPAAAAAYDRFYANFAGEELMRAMNADRAALGIRALATDATLEDLSRDRPIVCPSNGSLIIRGRARDMADRNYLSHDIPGCTEASGAAYGTFDLLKTAGYTFLAVGEDIAGNTYPDTATSYATGCDLGGGSCRGSITLPTTVAVAERGFMDSSGHRANLLSTTYDRFGCGAWSSSSGNHLFSCYFVQQGNGALDGTGPAFSDESGVGATFAVGSRPTFTATVGDAHSVLADGWAAIDGKHIHDWAWDHAGRSASVSVMAPVLAAGVHTLTWWARDASTRPRQTSFTFQVGTAPTPTATPRPTARPTPGPSARSTPPPAPTSSESPVASASSASPTTGPVLSTALASTQPGTSAQAVPERAANPAAASGAEAGGGTQPAGQTTRQGAAATAGAGDADAAIVLAAVGLLVLLGVGLVPPALFLGRSRRPPPRP